jgi:hypothetical protein
MGDVLIAWENEVLLGAKDLGQDKFDIVVPSVSILCEPTVSIVDRVVDKKGTRAVAQAYLEYLYSPEGQEIAARRYYRPRSEAVAKKYSSQFPKVKLFTLAEIIGDWQKAQKTHFAEVGSILQFHTFAPCIIMKPSVQEETWPFWWSGEPDTLAVTPRMFCSGEATKSSSTTICAPAFGNSPKDSNSLSAISLTLRNWRRR